MCAVFYLQLSVIHCLFVDLSLHDLHLFVEFDHAGVERDQTCALSGVEDTLDRMRRGVGHRVLTSKLRYESSRSCIHLELVDEIVFWCRTAIYGIVGVRSLCLSGLVRVT